MSDESDEIEPGRRAADVGPTDDRLTSGIEDEPEPGDGAEDGAASDDDDDGADVTPSWSASVRSVLAGLVFVALGIYFGLGQAEPDTGVAQLVVLVGLALALYGFVTWPRSGNVS
jgi:hypothetical protein